MRLNVTPLGRPRRRSFRSNLRSRFSCDLNPWPSARPDEGAPKGRAVGAPPSKALRRVRGRRGSSRPRPFPEQEKNREVQAPTEFPSKVVEMSPSRRIHEFQVFPRRCSSVWAQFLLVVPGQLWSAWACVRKSMTSLPLVTWFWGLPPPNWQCQRVQSAGA